MNYNEQILQSKCFGEAYDRNVEECKKCEVWKLCYQKCNGYVQPNNLSDTEPETIVDVLYKQANGDDTSDEPKKPEAKKPAKKPARKKKQMPKKEYSPDMPVFKDMSMEELIDLCKTKDIDLEQFERFSSQQIKRMRVIMALKKLYEL